ncbi:MAG: DUF433 domain-containing protein [Pyrinomonadaceae bacterium]
MSTLSKKLTPKVNPVTVAGSSVVTRSPKRMSGTPVFAGTRVPVKTLFDYLVGGYSLDVFFDHFPNVTPEQVSTLLDEIGEQLNERAK